MLLLSLRLGTMLVEIPLQALPKLQSQDTGGMSKEHSSAGLSFQTQRVCKCESPPGSQKWV